MSDTGGFQVRSRFSVDAYAHFIADRFDRHGVPLSLFQHRRISRAAANKEFVGFGFASGILAHFADLVFHAAIAFVDDGDAVESDLSAADVAVMATGVLAVVEFDVEHRGTLKAHLHFYDAVFGGNFQTVYRRVRLYGGLSVGGWHVDIARLGAFQDAVFDGEGRDDFVPDFGDFFALEIIRK